MYGEKEIRVSYVSTLDSAPLSDLLASSVRP